MGEVVNKHDQVAVNQIWREHIKKEQSMLTLNDQFHLSPSRMVIIPDKPNVRSSTLIKKSAVEVDPEITKALNTILENTKKGPLEKYEQPMTSSQEIGWYNKPLLKNRTFPKNQCDITKYASDFSAAQGHSPFARKPTTTVNAT